MKMMILIASIINCFYDETNEEVHDDDLYGYDNDGFIVNDEHVDYATDQEAYLDDHFLEDSNEEMEMEIIDVTKIHRNNTESFEDYENHDMNVQHPKEVKQKEVEMSMRKEIINIDPNDENENIFSQFFYKGD